MPDLRRYLIVDDNLAFAENLAEILTDAGATVDISTFGADALERAASTHYDALLSDMKMPAMSGAELVHHMRRLDPGLPAVVISAYTNDEDLRTAKREGVLAVLPKPVPMRQLIQLLGAARRDGVVAIVEDDPEVLATLIDSLQANGFTAVTATSVLETEQLNDVPPFVALVDLRVSGGEDGVALGRLAERFPGLPIVVMTAYADLPPPIECVAFFRKPFPIDALMEQLERLYRAHMNASSPATA